jgi:hypothetical protein
MNTEICNAIISLEDLVEEAKELHAITLIQYDSYIESAAFSNDSEVYKTITSIIERKADKLHVELQEKFNSLYALMKESVKNEKCPL